MNQKVSFFSCLEKEINQFRNKIIEKGVVTFTPKRILLGTGDSYVSTSKRLKFRFIQIEEPTDTNIKPEDLWFDYLHHIIYIWRYDETLEKFTWIQLESDLTDLIIPLQLDRFLWNNFEGFAESALEDIAISKIIITMQTPLKSYNTFGMKEFFLLDKDGNKLPVATNIQTISSVVSGLIDWNIEYSSLNTIMNFKTTTGGAYSTSYLPYIFGYKNTSYGWLGRNGACNSNAIVTIECSFDKPNKLIQGISYLTGSTNSSFGCCRNNKVTLYNSKNKILGQNFNYNSGTSRITLNTMVGEFIGV